MNTKIRQNKIIRISSNNKGFTLVELIVVLVVAAILGTMLVQFLNTSYFKSSSPITTLKDSMTLQNVIENITADYLSNFRTKLAGLKSKIGSEGSDQNNDYGVYRVNQNRFIRFNLSTNIEENDSSGSNNLLKITLVRINDNNNDAEFITVLYDLQ